MRAEPSTSALIIVVAYRADEHLAQCLAELNAPDVVVVDNDANEATREIVRSARGREIAAARYLAADGNIGFARAVNLAISRYWDGSSDVLLLNPDARISQGGVVALQAGLHSRGRVAAVGPTLVGSGGERQRATWPMPSPAQVWLDALGAGRLWRGRRFVVGAVLLLNGAALAELGGLDERYFLYAEEADWQMRAQRRGWTVLVIDDVAAIHAGGASSHDSALRDQLFHTSGQLFARRWYGWLGRLIMRMGTIVGALRRAALADAPGRRAHLRVVRTVLSRPTLDPTATDRA